jgi:hypothetical protein
MSQARREPRASLGDMVRSVALLLVPVLLFVGYQRLMTEEPEITPPVDYATAAQSARAAAPFDVLAPADLPDGWRATSVRYEPGEQPHWHLGVLTDDNEYVGLEQVVAEVDEALEDFAPRTSPAGSTMIEGRRWELRTDPGRGETTLVRRDGQVSTVITGTVSHADLIAYVESLES